MDQRADSIYLAVHRVFAAAGDREVTNAELYADVCRQTGVTPNEFRRAAPIGRAAAQHSPMARTARWTQQTMKSRGWLSRVPGKRGVWQLTRQGQHALHRGAPGRALVGFSTKLGIALVADCRDAFRGLGEPVHLLVGSPPYAIAKGRAYGKYPIEEYVDFICSCVEPVLQWLVPGGSVCLVIGNDVFEPKSPARALLPERLAIALHDRLGLSLVDRLIWHNPCRAPGPVQWASVKRVQLNGTFEHVQWYTNDPMRLRSDNRRVLQAHTAAHQRFIDQGGVASPRINADGAHRSRVGAFGRQTAGRIPRNVLTMSHTCADQLAYKRRARELGLPPHGAPFPVRLPRFLVDLTTTPGETVVDCWGGSQTSGVAAEAAGRRWITSELFAEYVRGGAERFDGAWINPLLSALLPRACPQRSLRL